jgi:hypothetical protein
MATIEWVMELARMAIGRDRSEIRADVGWPGVTPSLRKVLGPVEPEDSYSQAEVDAMARAWDELLKSDPNVASAVSRCCDDEWTELELAISGLNRLKARVEEMLT